MRQFIWTLNQIETDPVTHFRTYPFGKSRVPDRPAEIEEDTKAFQELKNNMMHMERIVLHILGFEFNVDHPTLYFHPLLKFFESVKHKKETRCLVTMDDDGKNVRPSELGDIVLQTAGAMANDCNSTTLCVQV